MVRPDLGLQSRREKGDPGGDSCSVGRASFAPLLHSRLPNRRRSRLSRCPPAQSVFLIMLPVGLVVGLIGVLVFVWGLLGHLDNDSGSSSHRRPL